ncbi:MAG: 3-isopropylmalate dehydratase large subunit [Candidatus Dormibacteria bacterium]
MTPRTLFERVWEEHVAVPGGADPDLLYIDLHLVHEVTSPQAFDGLRLSGRRVRRPHQTVATMDHNVPTRDQLAPIADPVSAAQVAALRRNCEEFGIACFGVGHRWQGIVHVMGPELGLTLPGTTIVCGDSHTATHGAFGALAFGIGTTEVEHVLATQSLRMRRPLSMEIRIDGALPTGVTAKDVALSVIHVAGTAGAAGHVVEYTGAVVRAMSMEERMTLCNLTIEAGGRAGMVAPDDATIAFLRHRPFAPAGEAWEEAVSAWRELRSDPGAVYDRTLHIDAAALEPVVTWGTTPAQSVPLSGRVPDPDAYADSAARETARQALAYMDLRPGTPMEEVRVDAVFIGSCTNARIEDLRAAAAVLGGGRVADRTRVLVVPGSRQVKAQAEAEGLDRVFTAAGAEWRDPGCSMCLGMNEDILAPGERCASTSNRNFEGRQGRGGRTHLVSPQTAAASALTGRLTDPRPFAGVAVAGVA